MSTRKTGTGARRRVAEGGEDTQFKQQAAREAMMNRNKKAVGDPMQPYYGVIIGFCVVCVLAIAVTLFSPKQKFADMNVMDESNILIHNGQGHQFKHGENSFFEHKTLADAKQMFMSALSDTNNLGTCKTSKDLDADTPDMEIELPDSYDWREAYPQCVQTPITTQVGDRNCSSSYAFATIGVVQDKICQATNKTVQLSAQEVIDCDQNQQGCEGGYVNKVLQWGKKKGFITADCHDYIGEKSECEVDHFETNECRLENTVYKINDYCIAIQDENIKRELYKNGPVIAQMQPYTDFLAYKEGSYHRTSESFKFNGYHIVKIVGYQQSIDGSTEWIVENSWGTDWGENGYVKMLGGRGDTQIDMYALGVAVHPYTMYDYQSAQNMGGAANEAQEQSDPMDEPVEDFNPDDFGLDSSQIQYADE